MKKISILLVSLIVLLTGCSDDSNAIKNSDGSILEYKKNAAPDGAYILNSKDELLRPTFEVGLVGMGDTIFQWFETDSYDGLIPVATSKDKLIVINSTSIPTGGFTLYKMVDLGYTVGVAFNVSSDYNDNSTNIYFTSNTNPTSPIAEYLSSYFTNQSNVWVKKVNSQDLKAGNFSNSGFLKGLEKNGRYTFNYYEGTKYGSIDLVADTRVFEQVSIIEGKTITPMQDTYFELELPSGLPEGYYVLEGYGMFKYEK